NTSGYNFNEVTGSLAGKVTVNGSSGLGGVTMTLSGTDINGHAVTTQTTATAANGGYSFTGLVAGTYTLTEAATPLYAEGTNAAGTDGGTVNGDTVSAITFHGGDNTTGYNFNELGASVAGTVYQDVNFNNVFDSGDVGL